MLRVVRQITRALDDADQIAGEIGCGAVSGLDVAEVGFQRIKTFGDFQETYQENDPDFFVHVAEKTHNAP